jgi:hypothetical protein
VPAEVRRGQAAVIARFLPASANSSRLTMAVIRVRDTPHVLVAARSAA